MYHRRVIIYEIIVAQLSFVSVALYNLSIAGKVFPVTELFIIYSFYIFSFLYAYINRRGMV